MASVATQTAARSGARVLCSQAQADGEQFSGLTNLADGRLGAEILFATDEWFATASNLLNPAPPVFDPDAFCSQGKVMDGWESRRRRTPGHDWSVVRLALAGYVHGVEIDTAYFTGNQVPAASVLAAEIDDDAATAEIDDHKLWLGRRRLDLGVQGSKASDEEIDAANAAAEARGPWVELVPSSPLRPGYQEATWSAEGQSIHRFVVPPELARKRVTHLRLNMWPDGGIARLRAWGTVARDFERELAAPAAGRIDLLSALNGGRALGCSDKHYGEPRNLLQPSRGVNMGDGWETARNPNRAGVIKRDPVTGMVDMPGVSDWVRARARLRPAPPPVPPPPVARTRPPPAQVLLRLAAVGTVDELLIDTEHFKGNFPESVRVEACNAPAATVADIADGAEWRELLPRTRLGPDAEHRFSKEQLKCILPRPPPLRTTPSLAPATPGAAEPTAPPAASCLRSTLGSVSHLRVSIFPDGGIMRVRAFGNAEAPMPAD